MPFSEVVISSGTLVKAELWLNWVAVAKQSFVLHVECKQNIVLSMTENLLIPPVK